MAYQEKLYTDIDLRFKPDPITGDVGVLLDADCVRSSVYRIISLNKYDIPFNIIDYSNLKMLLFEQPSHTIYANISTHLRMLLENLEPRITINDIDIDYDEVSSEYNVDVKYTIIRTNTEDVVNKKIERIR